MPSFLVNTVSNDIFAVCKAYGYDGDGRYAAAIDTPEKQDSSVGQSYAYVGQVLDGLFCLLDPK